MPYKDTAKRKAYQAAWYQRNKETLRPVHAEKSRAWRLANPERNKVMKAKHRAANRERLRLEAKERRRLEKINREHDERLKHPFPIVTWRTYEK